MNTLFILAAFIHMAPIDATTGFPSYRVVPAGTALGYTGQFFAKEDDQKSLKNEVLSTVAQLERVAGSKERIVRLHVMVSPEVPTADVIAELKAAFPDVQKRPALTLVRSKMEKPGLHFGLDAVVIHEGAKAEKGVLAVLPAGGRIDIAGQAEKADGTLAGATKATLESLEKTLKFLGSERSRTVQLKAFLKPMSDAATVRKVVNEFYQNEAPPLVLVEWNMALPIEIELVAEPGTGTPEGLKYATPPGMTESPVYSRTAVAKGQFDTIFTSGLVAPDKTEPKNQAEPIYGELKSILAATGSDMNHLTKATYYVTDAEANKSLDTIRPTLYDPKRPPTASKAGVVGLVHDHGQGLLVDMIAVSFKK